MNQAKVKKIVTSDENKRFSCYWPHPIETKDCPTDRHSDVEAGNRAEDREHDIEETNGKIEDEKLDLYKWSVF